MDGTYGHNGQIPEYGWQVDELDPAVMIAKAKRASDAPQGVCATAEADAATRLRTKTVVESMGAAAAGAHELLITKEP